MVRLLGIGPVRKVSYHFFTGSGSSVLKLVLPVLKQLAGTIILFPLYSLLFLQKEKNEQITLFCKIIARNTHNKLPLCFRLFSSAVRTIGRYIRLHSSFHAGSDREIVDLLAVFGIVGDHVNSFVNGSYKRNNDDFLQYLHEQDQREMEAALSNDE